MSTFSLRGIDTFFIGGTNETLDLVPTDPVALAKGATSQRLAQSGDYQTGQMYVQGFLNGNPRDVTPLLFWHGGGMTGATWETTPDGRMGWLELALRDGFDVYLSDAVERGRSSFPPHAISDMAAVFRPKDLAWSLFRMGPPFGYASNADARQGFAGQRFPIAHFDDFASQFVARWPALTSKVETAYAEYVQRFESAIIVAHSQGGGYAQQAALSNPKHIHALVLIEPSGAPIGATPEQLTALKDVPHLVLWGDYFDQNSVWTGYRQSVETYIKALQDAGGRVDVFDLPAMGINGNSHFPMMDNNNTDIWAMVSSWLQGL